MNNRTVTLGMILIAPLVAAVDKCYVNQLACFPRRFFALFDFSLFPHSFINSLALVGSFSPPFIWRFSRADMQSLRPREPPKFQDEEKRIGSSDKLRSSKGGRGLPTIFFFISPFVYFSWLWIIIIIALPQNKLS